MERRFICDTCGVKWHVPESRSLEPDPKSCASCGGALTAFVGPAQPGWDADGQLVSASADRARAK